MWDVLELKDEWHNYSVAWIPNVDIPWFYQECVCYDLNLGYMRDSVFFRWVLVPKEEHEWFKTRWYHSKAKDIGYEVMYWRRIVTRRRCQYLLFASIGYWTLCLSLWAYYDVFSIVLDLGIWPSITAFWLGFATEPFLRTPHLSPLCGATTPFRAAPPSPLRPGPS